MRKFTLVTSICIVALGFGCASQAGPSVDLFDDSGKKSGRTPQENDFFHAQGTQIVDGTGTPVLLRGVAFGNNVWGNPALAPDNHHEEKDYRYAAEMGFNTIRFYLNYRIFEDDSTPYSYKQSGFDWINQNLVWAKKYGIHLILNMHFPQGGFQSQGDGDALWKNKNNQKRFIALWKEIARRYADEPQIIGYDLLNEPIVTKTITQWETLARETVRAVREVDDRHCIFIERMNANKAAGDSSWDPDQNGAMNFFLIHDHNIVYEFHCYVPMTFSHQDVPWIPSLIGIRTSWPDPDKKITFGSALWKWSTFENPVLPSGTSDWAWYEGVPVTASKDEWTVGRLALQADALASGTAFFDDVILTERDPSGKIVSTKHYSFDFDQGFDYWSEPVSGSRKWNPATGRDGAGCWSATGSRSSAVIADSNGLIRVTAGNTYTVSGWMKGTKIPKDATARLRLDFLFSDGPVYSWNKEYLAAEIARYAAFGTKHDVPLYLGEFGCVQAAFDQGGLEWVSDIIDICDEKGISYNYHTWHEQHFGIFTNYAHLKTTKDEANLPLIELFTTKHQLK